MCPLCCTPSRLPAPRISKSRMAMPQPAGGIRRDVLAGVDEQVSVGSMLVAADAASQLVQVSQSIAIGFVDENRVGVRDVEAAFDDRRRQQQIEAVVDEVDHYLFQLA